MDDPIDALCVPDDSAVVVETGQQRAEDMVPGAVRKLQSVARPAPEHDVVATPERRRFCRSGDLDSDTASKPVALTMTAYSCGRRSEPVRSAS